MKPRTLSIALALTLLTALALLGSRPSAAQPQPLAAAPLLGGQGPSYCTVFYAADDQSALGGNNEDCFNPRTRIWFLPGEGGNYGVAVVGYEDLYPQGAVNEAGLFFDGLAVTIINVPRQPGKAVYSGNLAMKVMRECGTVDCVVQLYDQYTREGMWNGYLLFGDSAGDSVIIEPQANIRKEGRYQVATNFYQSQVKPEARTDRRYATAVNMLDQAGSVSVELFRSVLDATHQEGQVHTLYSTIYDLKQDIIYMYFFHDFENVVTLDLKKELAKGIHAYDIPSLFPDSPAAQEFGKSVDDAVAARLAALERVQVSAGLLASYAGRYELSPDQYIQVKSEGSQIFARDPSMPWVELVPLSEARFAQVVSDGMGKVRQVEVTFQSQAGKVTGLEYKDGAGYKTVAPRAGQPAPSDKKLGWLWFLAAPLLVLVVLAGLVIRRRGQKP